MHLSEVLHATPTEIVINSKQKCSLKEVINGSSNINYLLGVVKVLERNKRIDDTVDAARFSLN